jgi:hypothetical protein
MIIGKWHILFAGVALGLIPGSIETMHLKSEMAQTVKNTQAEIAVLKTSIAQWSDLADQHSDELANCQQHRAALDGKNGDRTILQAMKPGTMWVIPGKVVPIVPDQSAVALYRYVQRDGTSTVWLHAYGSAVQGQQ